MLVMWVGDMNIPATIISDQITNQARRTTSSGLTGRQSRMGTPSSRRKGLLQALSLPGLIMDASGIVSDANRAALELLNKEPEEILRHRLADVFTIDATVVRDCCQDITQTAELVLYHNGATRCLELEFSPFHSTDGRPAHLVLFHDVTERKRSEVARTTMIDTLESYAAAIAHDLKSPLATLMGFASLLEMGSSDFSEDHRQYARTIQKISGKMATMIDKLLLFATLEKLEQIPLMPLNMNSITSDVLETLNAMIKQHEATITIVPQIPLAIGYAPWIEVVFSNLISNAIKYGGQKPQIVISASQVGDKVYFWVHDNGHGLTSEQCELLFRQSVRFDPRPKGHGQGLMIARRIVERLGGEIGVSSLPGTGTTFYFTLPAASPTKFDMTLEVEIEAVRVD